MKKLIICLLVLIPFNIYADVCDKSSYTENSTLANNIGYETEYNMGDKTFKLTFYNVVDVLYLVYNGNVYKGNSDNEVVISNIKEGSYISVTVQDNSSCNNMLKNIYLRLPYYNMFFDDSRCEEYKGKLTICDSKFLSYQINSEIFLKAINNYNSNIEVVDDEKPSKINLLFTDVVDFVSDWGLKILLVIFTTLLSVAFYKSKFSKMKHGI